MGYGGIPLHRATKAEIKIDFVQANIIKQWLRDESSLCPPISISKVASLIYMPVSTSNKSDGQSRKEVWWSVTQIHCMNSQIVDRGYNAVV